MNYDNAIIAALGHSDTALRHRDLVALLDPEDQDYHSFVNIGMRLTQLYRAGYLTREKCDGRYWHYRLSEKRVINPGYTWNDAHGPIRVMAVAENYAMCRRPGAVPFIRSIKDIPQ